jgi:hypothetical protein
LAKWKSIGKRQKTETLSAFEASFIQEELKQEGVWMKKRVLSGAVALALASTLVLAPPALTPADAASFKDTRNHWSNQVVEKAYAMDLMKGYPGDVFEPESSVSRLEAIAIIIRAMGLENEALTMNYQNSGVTLPKGMTWGQGHLVLAAQKGLLHKDYVSQLMYNNPITRQEVAALVAVALRDKLKVKGDPAQLTYSDTNKIDTTYRPYVADVSQNKIMEGQGSNEFGPNDIMKRGQMAALMVKTNVDGWFDYGSSKIISGTLSGIDATTDIATINKSDGTQMPRLVGNNTIYYRGAAESTKDSFRAGEKVLAIVGSDAKIRYMEAVDGSSTGNTGGSTDTPAETQFTGKIVSAGSSYLTIRNIGYQEQTYPLAAGATVTIGSSTGTADSLTNGQFVNVSIRNNEIYSAQVLSSEMADGEVTGIYSAYFTVKTASGISKSYTVKASDIKIIDGSSQLSFSSLKTGDWVTVTSVSGEAREITRTSSSNSLISGEAVVRGVDDFYGYITLRDKNGNRKEYEVLVNAIIEKGNDRVSLDDLVIGDNISFKVNSNGVINEIIAKGSEVRSLTGTVTDLRTGSSPRIYIDDDRYDVDNYVEITKDGDEINLKEIMLGAEVTLKMDEDDLVTKIIVKDDENITVEGTVEKVDDSNNKITIEQSNGLEFILRVNSNCTIRDMTSSSNAVRYFDDIKKGWEVKLYLSSGKVKEIRVTSK